VRREPSVRTFVTPTAARRCQARHDACRALDQGAHASHHAVTSCRPIPHETVRLRGELLPCAQAIEAGEGAPPRAPESRICRTAGASLGAHPELLELRLAGVLAG
jgi:hypothetical protein